MAIAIPIAAAAIVAGTGLSIYSGIQASRQGRKAARAQERAREEQLRQQQTEERRRRRQMIRQERIQRALVTNVAGQVGALDSSPVLGGLGSLSSQLGANLGRSTLNEGFSTNISGFMGQAARAQASQQSWGYRGQLGSQISSFGTSLFNIAGGPEWAANQMSS